ncbi:MAG: hypothetical protein ACLP50_01725, partial [Solirubrobacteraceae bacterium]
MITDETQNVGGQAEEMARLRARVAELEAELVAVEDWASRTVGAAQERLYWLDRWHIDLNAVMERPGAGQVRALLRALRSVYR